MGGVGQRMEGEEQSAFVAAACAIMVAGEGSAVRVPTDVW